MKRGYAWNQTKIVCVAKFLNILWLILKKEKENWPTIEKQKRKKKKEKRENDLILASTQQTTAIPKIFDFTVTIKFFKFFSCCRQIIELDTGRFSMYVCMYLVESSVNQSSSDVDRWCCRRCWRPFLLMFSSRPNYFMTKS